ncbi:multiheme c-type cytochrome [Mariprofundus sp. EBB-1]|uniref:multiheme c-type cytochrome n=1 Tax=Mariprofundus sp. EBB-1 TaxID=2650971 RepID=UPI001F348992|nr:multiheme c-type cytochrome [Mariprofundus sp. EBB-1]
MTKPLSLKQSVLAVISIIGGLMLMAAAIDPGLPLGYWDQPSAKVPSSHNWSELEKDLRPEACAQCHAAQFNVWKKSLHAHAYSPGLVGQFPGQGLAYANDCLVCHAPLKEQLYTDSTDMDDSILLRLKHAEGFDADADYDVNDPDAKRLPLRHTGVSCAVCHVRNGDRFGPPPRVSGAVGKQDTPAHGGFTATKDFEQSQFCASCHQFPDYMAINGKPLENTLTEWKNSSFPDKGVTCQVCHMPDRAHEFRGIHDPKMVKKGLTFSLTQQKNSVYFSIASTWIGHAFPTYVTPKVIVEAEALNGKGSIIQHQQWEIIREVAYQGDGWKELRDTRIMPGETRQFLLNPLPTDARSVRYRVRVIPDNFYKGIYESLLSDDLTAVAGAHIRKANEQTAKNDYLLYEEVITLNQAH